MTDYLTVVEVLAIHADQIERYGGAFTKETWQSYEVEHRSGGPPLTGFASRNGRVAQDLTQLVKGDQWQAMQVYLNFEAVPSADNAVIPVTVR